MGIKKPNGKRVWALVNSQPVFDDKTKQLSKVVICFNDVTEIRNAQLRLEKSKRELDLFFNQSYVGFLYLECDEHIPWNSTKNKKKWIEYAYNNLRIAKVNQGMLNQYDCKIQDIIGSSVGKFVDESPKDFKAFGYELFDKGFISNLITKERKLDGTPMLIKGEYTAHYNQNGEIVGVFGVQVDITSTVKQEQQLKDTESKFQKTIESLPNALVIVNEELKIQFVNKQFTDLFEYEENEVLDKTVDFLVPEIYHQGHKFKQQDYLKQGGGVRFLGQFLRAITKSGKNLTVSISLNTFETDGKQSVIVILQDVSELKRKEDAIINQNKLLREIAWQQSHLVRRPVANILGIGQLLSEEDYQNKSKLQDLIDLLVASTEELDAIIKEIINKSEQSLKG